IEECWPDRLAFAAWMGWHTQDVRTGCPKCGRVHADGELCRGTYPAQTPVEVSGLGSAATCCFGAEYLLAWLANTNDGWLRSEHGEYGRRSLVSCAASERRATCTRSQSLLRQLSLRLQSP